MFILNAPSSAGTDPVSPRINTVVRRLHYLHTLSQLLAGRPALIGLVDNLSTEEPTSVLTDEPEPASLRDQLPQML